MKILITGANGMLGSSLLRYYYGKHKVYALHREKTCLSNCTQDYSLDLEDVVKVKKIINEIEPDLLIHCAGLTSVDRCEKEIELAFASNVNATKNIALSCTDKTKMVYLSTDQVYGNIRDFSENRINLKPINQYGKTKLAGEKEVTQYSSDHIIIRTNIFGWNVKADRVSSAEWIYNTLMNGQNIKLFTDYTFSPIFTEYLAEIILQLVSIGYHGIINVGSPIPCSKYTFGIKLAEEFGFDIFLIKKGVLANHNLDAHRSNKLDLNVNKYANTGLFLPNYVESIKKFSQRKPIYLNE